MDESRLEGFLARLYTDADFLERFIAGPLEVARDFGLPSEQAQDVARINIDDLRLAAAGFRAKGERVTAASHGGAARGRFRRWWRWRVRMPVVLAMWRLRTR